MLLIEMSEEEDSEETAEEIEEELQQFEETFEELRIGTLLTGPYDRDNAIVTLHAGAGGTESCDWTGMLYRMYTRWAEKKGYSIEELDYLEGDVAGVKGVTFEVKGENAYGYLRSEKGVHRLVRISPFNSAGKRQTSFASCDVIPDIEEDIDIEINDDDLKIDTYRSSGAGGQHINKTSSAVRITHLPTGIGLCRDTFHRLCRFGLLPRKRIPPGHLQGAQNPGIHRTRASGQPGRPDASRQPDQGPASVPGRSLLRKHEPHHKRECGLPGPLPVLLSGKKDL